VEHYDVIIVGSGAGGGTLAHRLAPTGKKILLLERGRYLPRERENWDSEQVFGRERYVTTERWYDKHGVGFRSHAQYFVGGNTKVYGGVLFRLRGRDFREVEHYGGVSPGWPLSYADLEPYYAEAERLYLVHGQVGEGPTEPPRSGPFPHPALSHEPRIQELHDDLIRTGHHPFHLPVGLDLDESNREAGRCIRCDGFDGFPCLTDGKADAHVVCVRPALEHPNVTLLTHARATRLEAGSSGRSVTQVVVTVDRGGKIHLAKTYHNTEPHRRLPGKLKRLLGPLGCHQMSIHRWSGLSEQIPLAGIAHNWGTVRFGTDPGTLCPRRQLQNARPGQPYVVETSFFPSSSAVNPSLTAIANALRIGDHLIGRLGARSAASSLIET
jgi:choline dehydrogenase-like flavoprotein